MRNLRKLCAVLLASLMLFSVSAVALAGTWEAQSPVNDGSRNTYTFLEPEKILFETLPGSPAMDADRLFDVIPMARGTPAYIQNWDVPKLPIQRHRVPLRI